MFFLILRLLSFCLDKVDFTKSNNKDNQFSLMSLLAYSFYPTFICNSQFVRFDDFFVSLVNSLINFFLNFFFKLNLNLSLKNGQSMLEIFLN